MPALAKPHRAGTELGVVEMRDRPARSLIASAADLAMFIRFALGDGRAPSGQALLRPETIKAMFEPQFAGQPLDFGHVHGLGWNIEGAGIPGAGPLAWMGGIYPGYSSQIVVAREQKLGVVVLSNDGTALGQTRDLARKALELALSVKLQRPIAAEAGPAKAPPVPYPLANLQDYAGDYLVFGRLVHVEAGDGKLSGEAFGKRAELIPTGKDSFMPQIKLLGSFDILGLATHPLPGVTVRSAIAAGRRFAVVEGFPEVHVFERIERRPLPAAWLARLGTYVCDNPDRAIELRDIRLSAPGDVLTLRTAVSSKSLAFEDEEQLRILVPISGDEAIAAGVGADEGDTLRAVERNGRATLTFSGFSFTRVP